ncbi:MAG: hypothetical protein A3G34_09835 [Candidatus Lindowbacteria bacterium RIFCSPLOWO2_12_FULL_62_27]|nr:MAG: hypothetical protein A3G34_09835 [Candidatus Lindowbacteria bacterium RIFCSPLOWO2_12_FULL_62_27]OGH61633.1 MAG: hypothetical protein A3I06_02840 [Candidatus Lindowbacteria bacterium RIFCSPLOWO2_02_FULL_62_12]
MRRLLEDVLRSQGHDVTACPDAETAWEVFRRDAHALVVLDLTLPGMDGLEFCRRLRATPQGEYGTVLVVTAKDSPEDLQAALAAGADDYLTKPVEPKLLRVRLAIAEHRVQERNSLFQANEKIALFEEQSRSREAFAGITGKSEPMQEIFRRLRLAAQSDVTVLILGESGTGKELVARGIHSMSARKDRPFIGVNCSAMPETLLASELFGHVRGSFTGAIRDKAGIFQVANGGTIFLDEVGDMDGALQQKLLRVLQEREIHPVGAGRPEKIDVRLITATNKDLSGLLSAGTLREDFYYRIRVFEILLPALRHRKEDIPLLVKQFLSEFSKSYHRAEVGIARTALERLMKHGWPGNVRELRNAIERAFVTASGNQIKLFDLPDEIAGRKSGEGDVKTERQQLLDALRKTGGNQRDAAKLLGVSRVTVWKKIRQFRINVKDLKSA